MRCDQHLLDKLSPEYKLRVGHPVGETTHADPDALKDAVACELVQHKGRLDHPRLENRLSGQT